MKRPTKEEALDFSVALKTGGSLVHITFAAPVRAVTVRRHRDHLELTMDLRTLKVLHSVVEDMKKMKP